MKKTFSIMCIALLMSLGLQAGKDGKKPGWEKKKQNSAWDKRNPNVYEAPQDSETDSDLDIASTDGVSSPLTQEGESARQDAILNEALEQLHQDLETEAREQERQDDVEYARLQEYDDSAWESDTDEPETYQGLTARSQDLAQAYFDNQPLPRRRSHSGARTASDRKQAAIRAQQNSGNLPRRHSVHVSRFNRARLRDQVVNQHSRQMQVNMGGHQVPTTGPNTQGWRRNQPQAPAPQRMNLSQPVSRLAVLVTAFLFFNAQRHYGNFNRGHKR